VEELWKDEFVTQSEVQNYWVFGLYPSSGILGIPRIPEDGKSKKIQ
jgi:hypothetical protein